jgi:transposase
MRKIRELLRLRWEQQLPQRVIANSLRLGQASLSDYLSRARRAGLTWPLPNALDDGGLEALLFARLPDVPSDQRPVLDWSAVHRDLRRPNVTRAAVGGIPLGDDRRVRLLVVLRSVSRVDREANAEVLSALAPASIAGRMKVEIFQAACSTLRTVAVRRRKWNLR